MYKQRIQPFYAKWQIKSSKYFVFYSLQFVSSYNVYHNSLITSGWGYYRTVVEYTVNVSSVIVKGLYAGVCHCRPYTYSTIIRYRRSVKQQWGRDHEIMSQSAFTNRLWGYNHPTRVPEVAFLISTEWHIHVWPDSNTTLKRCKKLTLLRTSAI